ncbi:MAG: transglycosylase SLT domain-containing protein [Nanoarchaeota archaeon]
MNYNKTFRRVICSLVLLCGLYHKTLGIDSKTLPLKFPNAQEIFRPRIANNLETVIESNITHAHERFVRTLRWDETISKAEEKYNIEKGLLAGLIMQESMGDPLSLNESNDGGAGLMMFQPGTARNYGLKVIGSSNKTGRDTDHGKQLRKLVDTQDRNYQVLAEIDERFDVNKSIDAGAKYLHDLHASHDSWDMALSAYNKGKPVRRPNSTQHVKSTRRFQWYYETNGGKIGQYYEYIRTNSRGEDIFRYEIRQSDSPRSIANNFNISDDRNRYKKIKPSDVVDKNRHLAGNKLSTGQTVFVKATPN